MPAKTQNANIFIVNSHGENDNLTLIGVGEANKKDLTYQFSLAMKILGTKQKSPKVLCYILLIVSDFTITENSYSSPWLPHKLVSLFCINDYDCYYGY